MEDQLRVLSLIAAAELTALFLVILVWARRRRWSRARRAAAFAVLAFPGLAGGILGRTAFILPMPAVLAVPLSALLWLAPNTGFEWLPAPFYWIRTGGELDTLPAAELLMLVFWAGFVVLQQFLFRKR